MTENVHDQLIQINLNTNPDEQFAQELEEQLRTIQMQMRKAETITPISDMQRKRRFNRPLFQLATIAASLSIITAAFLTVPSLRSFAQEIFDELFPRSDENAVSVERPATTVPLGTPPTFTIAEIQEIVEFEIKEPIVSVSGYELIEAAYNPVRNAVNILYQSPGRYLMITQQPLEDIESGLLTNGRFGIGPDAAIEEIELDGYIGQYVEGAWIESDSTLDSEEETITSTLVWNPSASARTLRWVQEDMVYEVVAMGGSEGTRFIGKDDMIEIALSLR